MTSKQSPCNNCTRVTNPQACENKYCTQWRKWFLHRWAEIYRYGQKYGCAGKGKGYELEK